MSPPLADDRRGGGPLTFGLAVLAAALFGFVGHLPEPVGPVVGAAGVVASAVWRRRGSGDTIPLVPALAALVTLAATAPAVPSAELFGALAALALLLWVADDPSRPAGGGRRAATTIAYCGVSVGLAWSVALALPRPTGAVGVAAGLMVAALLAVAILLDRAGATAPVPHRAS